MKTNIKRLLSIVMVLCLILTIVPPFVFPVSASTNSLTANQVQSYMNGLVGSYYPSGYCLAFVADCFEDLGATRSSACCAYNYGNSHIQSTDISNIPIGADVFFGNCAAGPCKHCGASYYGHIGVYVGDGYFIHATGGSVQKTKVDSSYWGSRFRGWGYHSNVSITGGSTGTVVARTEDPNYAGFLPIRAYPISTGNITVYNSAGTAYSNRYITGSTDLCIIHAIYTDGWCYISYPSSAESDGYFEAYVKLSTFTGSSSTSKWTSTGNYTAYRRSDLSATIGSVSSGDACLVVNTSGNLKQVIYPVTGSGYYKMGWINAGSSTTTTDSDFPTPILGYNYSANNRTTVYQYTSTLGGTSYGEIFVDDECTINAVSISGNWVNVTYPVSSGTKTGYVYLNQFFSDLGNISKPYTTKVSADTTVYRKSDMATAFGTVYSSDTITVVGKSGSKYQILYPITEGSNAGKYKLGWIYGTNIAKNLTGISVTTKPTKTVYLEGESFSTSGMVVTATYDDGSTAAVTGYTTSGYTSTPGSKTVTISYGGKTTAIDITVKSKSPTALTITTNPAKTTYFVGEEFDATGMVVKATYDNGTSANITDYYVSYDFSVSGTATVLIEYGYNNKTVSTSLSVTVSDPTLSGIDISAMPTKTTYYVGDTLNTSGLQLAAYYNDGSQKTVTSGFTCSPTTLNAAGTQTITVSYGGKSTTFTVTVNAVTLSSVSIATTPTKTTYYVGDTLDTAGLTMKATYNNGTTQTISTSITCTPTTLNTAGTQTITATYGGKSATFTVTVNSTPVGSMSVGKVTGTPGKQVVVPIKLDTNPGLIAARIKVSYDKNYLTLVKAEDGGILGEHLFGADLSASPYILTWENGLSSTNFTATGTLAYLTFEINANAPEGTLPITVSYDSEEVYNKDLANVALDLTQGSVTVEKTQEVDPNAAQIIAESKTAVAGDSVTVTISLKNNPGISGLALSLKYDEDVFTLKETKNGDLFSAFTAGKNYIWDASENITTDGLLLTLVFEISDTAMPGDYVMEVISRSCVNIELDTVNLIAVHSTVTVIDFVYGDTNGDTKIDMKDVVLLRKYLANYDYDTETSTETVNLGADANGDGCIDMKDVVLLRKYLANYDYDTESSTVVLGPQ